MHTSLRLPLESWDSSSCRHHTLYHNRLLVVTACRQAVLDPEELHARHLDTTCL